MTSKRVEQMSAPSRTGVWAILFDGKIVGKAIACYPKDGAGRLHLNLWDWSATEIPDVQYGWASGYGYDKVSAAFAGLTFNSIKLTDHPKNWEKCLQEKGFEVEHLL